MKDRCINRRLKCWAAAGLLIGSIGLAGCAPNPMKNLPSNASALRSSNTSRPDNLSVPLASGVVDDAEKALDVYEKAQKNLQSFKRVHLWRVESDLPLKTGEETAWIELDETGKTRSGKGYHKENYALEQTANAWVRTPKELTLSSGGTLTKYPMSELKEHESYAVEALMRLLLKEYPWDREGAAYRVKVNSQSGERNQAILKALGYQKKHAKDYEGTLYLEARIDGTSGYLTQIQYAFDHRVFGVTDKGTLTFSQWNQPVDLTMPKEGSASTPAPQPSKDSLPAPDQP
ncbi:hypothetical protein ABB02_00030 [Clostridiaceae bacterium JG1575]|nr:hypothetical protein ABB02_00030 [Clostridiaceae bacterium JG1575]